MNSQTIVVSLRQKPEMSIREKQEQIVDEFSQLDDWMNRYEMLIELGNSLETIDPKKRNDQNLIKGCQSRVWLDAELVDGKVFYSADSDAIITKGIVALLIRVLNGHTPQEILGCDLYFIDSIGLKENLSPTRSNGLLSMIKQMRLFALAYKTKLEGS